MVNITFFARLFLVLIKPVLEQREEKMVLCETEFGWQDASIASESLDELSNIRLVAPGCGVSKTRHSVSTEDTVFLRCRVGRNCDYVIV